MDAVELLRSRLGGAPIGSAPPIPQAPVGQQSVDPATADLPPDLNNPLVLTRLAQGLFGGGAIPMSGALESLGSYVATVPPGYTGWILDSKGLAFYTAGVQTVLIPVAVSSAPSLTQLAVGSDPSKADSILVYDIRAVSPYDAWTFGVSAGELANEFTINNLNGFSPGVYLHLNGTGLFQVDHSWFYPSLPTANKQSVTALVAGNGAPNNTDGANGMFYFRGDGAAGSFIYHKAAGVWTAIL